MVASIHRHAGSLLCVSLLAGCGGGNGGDVSHTVTDDQPKFVTGNDGPEGDSGLNVGSLRYPLDSALADIWGVSGNHFQIDFTLTNGNFTLGTIVREGQTHQVLVPAMATAVFRTEMYSAGSNFDYGSYGFIPVVDAIDVSAGVGYFTHAFVGVDTDQDGTVSDAEQIAVVDGAIEFAGALPDISLSFSLTLGSGQNVTGEYTGLFDFTRR